MATPLMTAAPTVADVSGVNAPSTNCAFDALSSAVTPDSGLALAPHPAILVADEPTGNLDEATGREIVELLFAGHEKRGTTLVLVTHDMALAQRCDRVVRLRSGRIEAPETVA